MAFSAYFVFCVFLRGRWTRPNGIHGWFPYRSVYIVFFRIRVLWWWVGNIWLYNKELHLMDYMGKTVLFKVSIFSTNQGCTWLVPFGGHCFLPDSRQVLWFWVRNVWLFSNWNEIFNIKWNSIWGLTDSMGKNGAFLMYCNCSTNIVLDYCDLSWFLTDLWFLQILFETV